MRLNCLKYLDRSFGSVDTSQGSRLNQVFTFQTVVKVFVAAGVDAVLVVALFAAMDMNVKTWVTETR